MSSTETSRALPEICCSMFKVLMTNKLFLKTSPSDRQKKNKNISACFSHDVFFRKTLKTKGTVKQEHHFAADKNFAADKHIFGPNWTNTQDLTCFVFSFVQKCITSWQVESWCFLKQSKDCCKPQWKIFAVWTQPHNPSHSDRQLFGEWETCSWQTFSIKKVRFPTANRISGKRTLTSSACRDPQKSILWHGPEKNVLLVTLNSSWELSCMRRDVQIWSRSPQAGFKGTVSSNFRVKRSHKHCSVLWKCFYLSQFFPTKPHDIFWLSGHFLFIRRFRAELGRPIALTLELTVLLFGWVSCWLPLRPRNSLSAFWKSFDFTR